jgi:hypothetical protein
MKLKNQLALLISAVFFISSAFGLVTFEKRQPRMAAPNKAILVIKGDKAGGWAYVDRDCAEQAHMEAPSFYESVTVDECKKHCNDYNKAPLCQGFSYNEVSKSCYLKTGLDNCQLWLDNTGWGMYFKPKFVESQAADQPIKNKEQAGTLCPSACTKSNPNSIWNGRWINNNRTRGAQAPSTCECVSYPG